MGDRVVHGPAREGRPPVDVMGPERSAASKQVAGDVEAAVRPVVLRVAAERSRDPERGECPAVDHPAAGADVRGDVEVGIDEALDGPVRGRPLERLASGVGLGLGVPVAPFGALEEERQCGVGWLDTQFTALG